MQQKGRECRFHNTADVCRTLKFPFADPQMNDEIIRSHCLSRITRTQNCRMQNFAANRRSEMNVATGLFNYCVPNLVWPNDWKVGVANNIPNCLTNGVQFV
ncbi:hypothetical protein CEXT_88581 [Caerostris extrusa]|uniref:Uncharacterized protein n=1 Tax=Caerostris extrusa TaxID=172846 RepID=A0AAV4MAS4_CAEEX|nr:hypothetical protein CEXT_88581 [Caerostris extrusa]